MWVNTLWLKQKNLRKLRLCSALTTLLAGTVQPAIAENVHLGMQIVEAQELIKLLAPRQDVKTRSNSKREPRSVSLEVYFAFDSANLSAYTMAQLSPVAEAMFSEELANIRFTLEGHTDSIGASVYNQGLSERRALAVESFFTRTHGIEGSRLKAIGKGESEPLIAQNPKAPQNRRVKIIAH